MCIKIYDMAQDSTSLISIPSKSDMYGLRTTISEMLTD